MNVMGKPSSEVQLGATVVFSGSLNESNLLSFDTILV